MARSWPSARRIARRVRSTCAAFASIVVACIVFLPRDSRAARLTKGLFAWIWTPSSPSTRWAAPAASRRDGFRSGFVTLVGRPNAGKVDAAQRDHGQEDRHHVQHRPDDAPSLPRRADARRLPAHHRGHPGPAQAPRRARRGAEHLRAQGAVRRRRRRHAHRRIQAGRPRRRVGGPAARARAMRRRSCVLSKADLVNDEQLAAQREAAWGLAAWDGLAGLSAQDGDGVEAFVSAAVSLLPRVPRGSRPTWTPTSRSRSSSPSSSARRSSGRSTTRCPMPSASPSTRWTYVKKKRPAPHRGDHLRGARQPEGHHHRQGRLRHQAHRHRGAHRSGAAARLARVLGAQGEGAARTGGATRRRSGVSATARAPDPPKPNASVDFVRDLSFWGA